MTIGIDARLWSQTGVGRYIRNLVFNLQKLDRTNNYTLFVRSENSKDIAKQIANSKWRMVVSDIGWHSLKEQVNFLKFLNKENLDLVHFPYISVPYFYNRAYVVTIHDLIPLLYPTGNASTLFGPLYQLKLIAYQIILGRIVKKANKIIVPSQATKNEIIQRLKADKNKIAVTYEGASEITKTSNLKLNSLKLIKGQYFLYVGNAYPHKNLEKLIQAFQSLKSDKVKLALVGRRDYFYKRLEENTLARGVIFAGEVSEEELVGLYQNALALVQPSLMEGFGLPVLEAMACRCLVICSNIPALKEIAKEDAIYFNPESTDDIKNKLESILNNSTNFQQKIEEAYARSKEFSFEKMAKETLEAYESAL